MKQYTGRFARTLAKTGIAAGLAIALTGCGSGSEETKKSADPTPAITYNLPRNSDLDDYMALTLKERGNDDSSVNKYKSDRAKGTVVYAPFSDGIEIIHDRTKSLGKIIVGSDGAPIEFQPSWRFRAYEFTGEGLAEKGKDIGHRIGQMAQGAKDKALEAAGYGPQIFGKPCKVAGLASETNVAAMNGLFPIGIGFVPVKLRCGNRDVYAGLDIGGKVTDAKFDALKLGIETGGITQVDLYDSSPWIYEKLGDVYVWSPKGFHVER